MDALKTPTPFNRERFRQCCSGLSSQGTSLALLSPETGCAGRAGSGQEPKCCLFCSASCTAGSALFTAARARRGAAGHRVAAWARLLLSPSSHQRIRGSSKGG